MPAVDTLILGAGLAGLSTALHLPGESLILEKSHRPGGLAVSHSEGGYTFDVTGHWLHMRDPAIRERFGGLVVMPDVVRTSRIFTHQRLIAYPFQSNLKDLPANVLVECLMGAIDAHVRRAVGAEVPQGFGDFVLHHFGEGIAREFMFPYNTKLWGVSPFDISHSWCQRFVPVPDLRQIVEGAVTARNEGDGYNATFSYPRTGGIEAFSQALAGKVRHLELNREVAAIHPGEKWVETVEGIRYDYNHLVSSLPLKWFVQHLVEAPEDVRNAAALLRCTSLNYLDLGLNRPALKGQHWVYLPDPKTIAYRIGSFSNACAVMAPEGCSSLYVELGNHREYDEGSALDEALDVLSAMDRPVARENVDVCRLRRVDHAYVIYDRYYEACLSCILPFLEEHGILSVGRYGKWVYASMEDALIDGRNAAKKIEEEE